MGWLVSACGTTICEANLVVVGTFSFHVAVVVLENKAPVLRCLGEEWLMLPSPLDVVSNSSVEPPESCQESLVASCLMFCFHPCECLM
jgi:hypothetical protein